eukprot:gene10035-2209_t
MNRHEIPGKISSNLFRADPTEDSVQEHLVTEEDTEYEPLTGKCICLLKGFRSLNAVLPKLSELKLTGINGNRIHSREDMRKIQRENVLLLTKLEEIQRKGAAVHAAPAPPRKHEASSTVNRRKKQRETENQNKAFLKRLEGVRSTVPKPNTRSKARPGPPKSTGKGKHSRFEQPEWME